MQREATGHTSRTTHSYMAVEEENPNKKTVNKRSEKGGEKPGQHSVQDARGVRLKCRKMPTRSAQWQSEEKQQCPLDSSMTITGDAARVPWRWEAAQLVQAKEL